MILCTVLLNISFQTFRRHRDGCHELRLKWKTLSLRSKVEWIRRIYTLLVYLWDNRYGHYDSDELTVVLSEYEGVHAP